MGNLKRDTFWIEMSSQFFLQENRLHLLKRYSHFIHFCQTPLLFNTCSKANDKNSPVEEKVTHLTNTSATNHNLILTVMHCLQTLGNVFAVLFKIFSPV